LPLNSSLLLNELLVHFDLVLVYCTDFEISLARIGFQLELIEASLVFKFESSFDLFFPVLESDFSLKSNFTHFFLSFNLDFVFLSGDFLLEAFLESLFVNFSLFCGDRFELVVFLLSDANLGLEVSLDLSETFLTFVVEGFAVVVDIVAELFVKQG
jgi:hypothetical protein